MSKILEKVFPDDAALVAMIQDPVTRDAGFRLLVEKYQEPLYWHIRKIVTFHEDADDVIQNTFIKVYRGIKNFKGQAKLYTWLYRIATNESLTFLKEKKRKQGLEEAVEYDLSDKLHADKYFDGDQVEHMMALAINELPDKQKIVFNMRYYDDMSYADMSEVLDTSIGALKASYHHAVKKIESFIKTKIG